MELEMGVKDSQYNLNLFPKNDFCQNPPGDKACSSMEFEMMGEKDFQYNLIYFVRTHLATDMADPDLKFWTGHCFFTLPSIIIINTQNNHNSNHILSGRGKETSGFFVAVLDENVVGTIAYDRKVAIITIITIIIIIIIIIMITLTPGGGGA